MFVNRARECPSVVSTRVLKTHRMNSVENFRLQERVKTIDYESQHNYSQISDEIDGVRQNLVRIKGIKKNVGVSVERRKLLRDRGLRILPSKQKGDVDYLTVRTSNGKDVNIPCSDFYDGDTLRKQLNIDNFDLAATPSLTSFEVENSDNEDVIDFTSAESRGRCHSASALNLKEFRYRKITPPLRPGSRRNFKNVDDEKSEDDEKLLTLENFPYKERKYGMLRPQTAYTERERPVIQRPRSCTCPANIQENEGKVPSRKISRKISQVAENERKKSRFSDSAVSETTTSEKSTKQEEDPNNQQRENCNNDAVFKEKIPLKSSIRPKLGPRSLTVALHARSTGMSCTVTGMRRMSLDTDKSIQFPSAPLSQNWFQSHSPETSPRVSKKSVTIENEEDKERTARRFTATPDRKVSWKDNERNGNNDNKLSENSMSSDGSYMDGSAISQQRTSGRVNSAPQPRPRNQTHSARKGQKVNGKSSSQDFVYDARPDKALSKGYMTMQMTIGNKQVMVYVPKFSPGDCLDDVTVERARAKSAVKAAAGTSRSVAGKRK